MLRLLKSPIYMYRVAHKLHKAKIPLLPLLITYFIRFFWAAFIPHDTVIGKGTKVGYGGLGVILHRHLTIGSNCLISQNVTIGGTGTKPGVPRIGDNVYIGAGAVILGPIFVGNNSIIGANSVVLTDVKPNTVVAGVPAKTVKII